MKIPAKCSCGHEWHYRPGWSRERWIEKNPGKQFYVSCPICRANVKIQIQEPRS